MPNNVTCPECEKDVVLSEQGTCPNCGLEVAAVLARDRAERALQKLRDKRKADEDAKKPKPKKSVGIFDNW